jgi:hypothetical protein
MSEIDELRAEIRREIAELRGDIGELRAQTKKEDIGPWPMGEARWVRQEVESLRQWSTEVSTWGNQIAAKLNATSDRITNPTCPHGLAGPDYCVRCQAQRKEVAAERELLKNVGERVQRLEGQMLNVIDDDETRDSRLDEHETEIKRVITWLRENVQTD